MTVHKNTPMMKQYFSIKEKYPDTILFYRMGDFYEMFYKDAEKAAPLLEIALTSRNKNNDTPIPMCGIPFRAADTYIAKLIKKGCKVALCEQVEDPAIAKGLVKRKVVRVITSGMILNENLLDKNSNNFLLCICINDSYAGLSFLDISTGLFCTTQIHTKNGIISNALIDEALKVDASEIILPFYFKEDPLFNYIKKAFSSKQITYLENSVFNLSEAKSILTKKFKTRSLQGFGCEDLTAGVVAAGAIISYVEETQLQTTDHILCLKKYELNSYLLIDDKSCRNLELLKNIQTGDKKGTLLNVLDKTVTAMGSRLIKTWIRYPLIEKNEIEKRLSAVSDAKKQKFLRQSIIANLKSVYDLERLGTRISMGHGNAKDLIFLKKSLFKLPDIFKDLNKFSSILFKGENIKNKEKIVNDLTELANLIHKAIREDAPHTLNEGGIINNGFDKELDELLEIARHGRKWILKTGIKEKEKTGLSSLKIKYNKIFGYFIEVSKAQAKSVPDNYIRKQTLVNAERFITDELKQVEEKVLNAYEKRSALEYFLFCKIKDQVTEKTESILKIADFLASIDVLFCFAEIADENNYLKPEINIEKKISIINGRHPVVEQMITGERYVPNTVNLDNDENQVLIITGPNMAGKSTILRQVAIISLMAQMGCFVPAEKASLCIIDKIFTRVGALDNLSQGQSTFMVEMEETANILNNAKENSLVILDEIGRGTSTFDGMSIAWAVAEFLHDIDKKGVKTLFATHYHELTRLEQIKPRIKNFNIAVKEFNDNIVFLRKLVKGGTNKSYGIQVARLAGIPDKLIIKAKKILSEIEENAGNSKNKKLKTKIKKPLKSKKLLGQQMELFKNSNNDEIVNMLEKIDILSITPIDALNFLHKVKQKMMTL